MYPFLQIDPQFSEYKYAMLAFMTAFVVAMVLMPPLIKVIEKFKLFDEPDERKMHISPVPTLGGIAACIGMGVACILWFPFSNDTFTITFFFSAGVLLIIGIMDDLKHLSAKYKFAIQVAIAFLIAFSGVRVNTFNGLFGIEELPISAQYTFTILAITGITNAFNLIDGIDGLAGGLGFMSLVILGLFLNLSDDATMALIAFSLAGGVLGFLYYNFNPAKIFMGDTGSLVLGFVLSILCIKFIQLNSGIPRVIPHAPVFTLSVVFIPVFDTIRVFAIRIWQGRSPFAPDKNHIHHLLTNNGWSHSFSAKLICGIHAIIVVIGYFLKDVHQLVSLALLSIIMGITTYVFSKMKVPQKDVASGSLMAQEQNI
ncbi:MAG TPA: MraY family glycosyltransferase [Flavisolibacter sp.]|nr:MraY family glycosyltransferase [Flavisolibacter sp.]